MPALRFNHYNLRVQATLLDALKDFYCDVVGLAAGPRPPLKSRGHWLYADGQAVLHLSEIKPGEPPRTHGAGTFDHAAFSCTGRAGYEQLLSARGIPFRRAQVPEAGQVQLFITDPAGNGVELNFDEPAA